MTMFKIGCKYYEYGELAPKEYGVFCKLTTPSRSINDSTCMGCEHFEVKIKLNQFEMETTINYNNGEHGATVDTCNKSLMRRLDSYCEEFPEHYQLLDSDEYRKVYACPKKLITIRKPRILTDEQRRAYAELARKNLNK